MFDALLTDTQATIAELNEKVRSCVTMGKPGEVADYAMALSSAASALRDLAAASEGLE